MPVWRFCRHGAEEWGLRTLSAGRYLGLVTTRSVAETVFISQLLREYRQQQVDIDSTAQQVFKEQNPSLPVPSKLDQPVEFMGLLVQEHVKLIQRLAPSVTEGKAIQQFQQVRNQLAQPQRQLRAAGLAVPPVEGDAGVSPRQHEPAEEEPAPPTPEEETQE